ncbi:MAG: hypothetical protein IKQ49_03595, partial [Eubacterium sp.]|nr:hypothetical protein [Eubacterium sp.]
MNDRIRNSYFVFVRLALLIVLSVCGVLNELTETGVSLRILLLVSFYIGLMAVKELLNLKGRRVIAVTGLLVWILLIYLEGMSFWLLGFYMA